MHIYSIYQPKQLENVLNLYAIQQALLASALGKWNCPAGIPPLEDNWQSGEVRSKLYFTAARS